MSAVGALGDKRSVVVALPDVLNVARSWLKTLQVTCLVGRGLMHKLKTTYAKSKGLSCVMHVTEVHLSVQKYV